MSLYDGGNPYIKPKEVKQMANLYINEESEKDQKRVVLLSQAMEKEHTKALLDTVRLTIEVLEKSLQRDAYSLTDGMIRHKVAMISAYKNVLELPNAAMDYICNVDVSKR